MVNQDKHIFEFGSFRLNPAENLLLRNGQPVRLPLRTFEVLLFFVKRNNEIIDKRTLMEEVWQDTFVEDANLTVHISTLRKIFAEDAEKSAFIENFPKRGYRLTADVKEINGNQNSAVVSEYAAVNETPDKQNGASEEIIIGQSEAVQTQIENNFSDEETNKTFAKKKSNMLAALFLVVTIVLVSGYVLNKWFDKSSLSTQKITRVPGTENSVALGISPNGEYLAHAISKAGKRSLYIKHITSDSSVQLLPAADVLFTGLTFSNDGNFLYYVQIEKDNSNLYKIPILGGEAKLVLANVLGRISFSPDGKEFVFVRESGAENTTMMIAKTDGSEERAVGFRQSPEFFYSTDLSWSPDGKIIACAAGIRKRERMTQIVGIDVENSEEKPLSDKKWAGTDGLAWMSDGSGLIFSGFESGTGKSQIWFLSYPSGKLSKITNDLNNYGSVGLTADSKTLLAGQFEEKSGVWLDSNDNLSQPKLITSEQHHNFKFISWTRDDRILFGSSYGENRDVWIMNADGSKQTQLTSNARENVQPTATADNRFIVFVSDRSPNGIYNIWKMNIDGTNPVQLTNGNGELHPVTTPDRKWVFYTSGKMETPNTEKTIWKIPFEGGEPAQIVSSPSYRADISPDGRHFACWYKLDEKTPWKIAIFPIEGGNPIKLLDAAPGSPIHWTPDGNAISFVKTIYGISNIWNCPINGDDPKQLTQFTSERIVNFDWSEDNRLILSRSQTVRDVVLITDFK